MRRLPIAAIAPALVAVSVGCRADEPPNLVRQTIGVDGGVIASHDGVLTIVILPGALSSPTDVEVFPSVEPPTVFGPAYRVRPDVELEVAAEVTYKRVLPNDPSRAAVAAIRLDDYVDEMGHWQALPTLTLDADDGSVTATDSALSLYYALVETVAGGGTTTGPDPTTGDETTSGFPVTATSGSTGDSTTTTDPTDPTTTTDPTDSTDSTTSTDPTATTGSTTDPTMPGTESSGGMMMMQMCGDAMPIAGEVCYVAGGDFAVGMGPTDLVVADFDGDTDLDVVTSNAVGGDVTIMLGNGDGTFGGPTPFAVGLNPVAIAAGDFDGTGTLDVAVANLDDDTIGVLPGGGDGTFGAMVVTMVGDAPSDLVVADFGAGAADDLAVVNSGDSTLQALTGGPGAVLTASMGFVVQAGSAGAIATGEYNSDAMNDAFVVGAGGNYHGWAGDGAGGFVADASGAFAGNLVAVDWGDINGNNSTDLVAVDVTAEQVQLRGGTGAAGFFIVDTLAAGTAPSDVAVGDLSGEGPDEIVVVNAGSNDVMIYANVGGAFPLAFTIGVGAGPSAVKLGDVTGDGVLDIVTANGGADTISVIESDP